ncbi:putative assembly protein [mine drainage metagenome]|uniref:Putative assembly protein n=1 Tax=mine drainage metagenome TaxID=410659 RepID=A0A1J5RZE9_9ZZZZ
MRPLKIAGVTLALIVVVAGTGIVIVASRFGAPWLKAELAQVVQKQQQRTLKIDGNLELGFWPDIGVKLGKLSLSERNSAQIFASADSARVSVALLPLLSKRIVVNSVALSGVRTALIRHKDGTLNIDDLRARYQTGSQPLRLDIAAIKIANAQVSWTDEQSGSTATVSGIDIATSAVSIGGGSYSVSGLSLAIGAAHQLDAKLELSGIEGTGRMLKVVKIAFDLDGRSGETAFKTRLDSALTADLEGMSATLDNLSGETTLSNPKLPMKRIALPFSGRMKLDLSARSAEGNLAARLGESKIALKFDHAKLSPPSLGFALDIDRINADQYLPPQRAVEGRIDFSALNKLKLDGTVRIGSLQIAKTQVRKLKLRIRAADGRWTGVPETLRTRISATRG